MDLFNKVVGSKNGFLRLLSDVNKYSKLITFFKSKTYSIMFPIKNKYIDMKMGK